MACLEGLPGESLYSLKKNMAARLRFAKLHLNKPQDFWNNVIWSDETIVEMFGHDLQCHIWWKLNTAYQHKQLKPTVKYADGSLIIWACFEPHDNRVDHELLCIYQSILKSNVRPSVRPVKLGWKWLMQQDNDPKHTSKFTTRSCYNGPVKVQTSTQH